MESILTVIPNTKDIIIEDPVLEPYFIVSYKEGGFGVCKKRLDKNGKLKYSDVNYPNTFVRCLQEVAKQQMLEPEGTSFTIQAYIDRWQAVSDKILNAHKVWNVPEI